MTAPFRVALSGDFRKADGSPVYPDFDLAPLKSAPGVDCLWVGHFDLSVSLGVPGQFDSKVFKDAIAKVVTAADRHKKALGRLVPSVEQGIELNSQGFDFICYSREVRAFGNQPAFTSERVRAGCKPKKARSKK